MGILFTFNIPKISYLNEKVKMPRWYRPELWEERVTKTIAFVHHKGGTGKTTSCLSIAGYLAKARKRVLVVDFDPQGNATSGLGIDHGSLDSSMYDVLVGTQKLRNIILQTKSGVHLAPSSTDLVGAGPIFYKRPRGETLRKVLKHVARYYDYILIDAPPGVGQFMINAVIAADHTIVTLDPGIFALEGVKSLNMLFDEIRESLKIRIKPAFAILTRCSKPVRTPKRKKVAAPRERAPRHKRKVDPVKEIQRGAKKIFKKVSTVPYSVEIFEAQAKGLPISHYAPRCGAAQAYKRIVNEVMKYE